MKKLGQDTPKEPVVDNKEPKGTADSDVNAVFNYEEEQKTIQASLDAAKLSQIDSSITEGVGSDVTTSGTAEEIGDHAAFLTYDEDKDDPGLTLHPKGAFAGQGFTPANEVNTDKRPVQRQQPNVPLNNKRVAKPATEIDLANLDESKILDMPQIKAATFEILSMLDLKPKDPAIRFRWANYKNNVAGNLARYYALGFENALLADVDTDRSPVHESMVDGTQVKYYDIVLLKVNVIRLMELYKANIIKSVNRLVKHRERGLKEANREFTDGLTGRDKSNYNKMRDQLQKEPVEFFTPGVEESQVVGR